ncbi:shematrin-like protein 1 [Schistocerca gregaria]|uniref:shematrin-like protein 1 n=1 Tax=Schistocerca gregaria TaxID=7010 RepID=UPI00211E5BF6|nr:shematrin-like protein 1 [Schistocerca gregaria]
MIRVPSSLNEKLLAHNALKVCLLAVACLALLCGCEASYPLAVSHGHGYYPHSYKYPGYGYHTGYSSHYGYPGWGYKGYPGWGYHGYPGYGYHGYYGYDKHYGYPGYGYGHGHGHW